MQHVANIVILTPGLRARIDLFFASLGQGVNAYSVRRKRLGELARLDAMSDAELSELGITRDRIPHYVFRDLFST
ncbi:DUF1127 domain-containing protein [Celeribacter halophilus]|jgi:uncharacterized protein YjiS (DUF1127 family)|uniref:DUF1127 domain-containing protein n=1 Tax=Celeribacter halophilus TaxID=576117 RepID=A0A1I3N8L5_9RHOB|nr:DUF1127 domain-containing protein [Celeribacter halophilus]MBU2889349.1 DUF1127 domain-containing protein [Celeribacter halophilus]MDO6458071.1 DUF1127 domain-containing protein [Celeribacter halophilus]MDO6509413.1 DUF1127 domain-containing protein [Celeribacter halophilus]MDO6724674.1 DUF1127 domain-containing protein [Celeribacter halophilus]PZX15698.1 uncharacterized protein DUF1127 [Celeribacter halophilus]